jgi:DNA replication and repair protein RecF
MPVQTISIDRFRNLKPVTLQCSPQLNLFTGANAAGKTSILESLYILGRARSFRTRSLQKAIQTGNDRFQLVARVQLDTGRGIPVGISQHDKQLLARIDGKTVKRLSELAVLFPVHWVGGNLHRLIEEGPGHRRQYLDWGLFHVKPGYISVWQRYQRLLKQRNAALRANRSAPEIRIWDNELATAGEELHAYRDAYTDQLGAASHAVIRELLGESAELEIGYRPGWRADLAFLDALRAGLDKDREQGFTRCGPHRADVSLLCNGLPVSEQLSRGQQKLLVVGLQVAQARLLKEGSARTSLFLIDDLGSELDSGNQGRVMSLLGRLEAQVFATAIDLPDVSGWSMDAVKRFHVKHGCVSEVV